jgi:hypothetical protein
MQDLSSSTRVQARFYYAPNQFIGNNEERQSGQKQLSAERFTSYIWSTRLIHDVTPDLSLRLLGRYGLRRFDEAFSERNTNFWTIGPHVDWRVAPKLKLGLSYHYERGLAQGRNQPQFEDDTSYINHYLSADVDNEAHRSKLRGITELKHPELTKIFLRLPLPLHVPFDSLPVCPFPYRGHVVPIGPKLPAPQYPLHRGLSAKDLPRRDALEYLHNPAWSHFRMCTAEQMDMILVRPDRLHLDRKPFRDLCRRLLDNRRHHLIQQRFPVFHGKNNMVVDLPRTVRSLSDCLAPLVRHTPEGTRKDCPRSKLRGITS